MGKLKVAVLRGGPSSEYEVSLKSGEAVLKSLDREKYTPADVFISKGGTWHVRGIPTEPHRVLGNSDMVFNALHGEYGEDGTVQRLLDSFGIPYTGSAALSSAVAMNKPLAKKEVVNLGAKLAHHRVFSKKPSDVELELFFRTFPQPSVVKPVGRGSSVGVAVVRSLEELRDGIKSAFKFSPKVLVEGYIKGREATCGVIENFRGEDVYALPPVEIIPAESSSFFDYKAKYDGKSQEICPSNFSHEIKQELERLAREVHKKLRLRHYSRSDFIVAPSGIYFLEVNTLPGLTPESLLPKAVKAVGCSFSKFVDHAIGLAQRK